MMRIENLSKNTVLADTCKIADNFFARFFGLMGKDRLSRGSGLLITPCNSIHMFFMKIPLDVVFIDKNNIIVYLLEDIRPWKISPVIRKACSTIELPAGTIKSTGTEVGDRLSLI